ncbi:lipocalin-like domain-containing protein [uncultured Draconibacterium sp.]|uniref:lipocalin-like domain-containing protein n=1 Tax=uncultured Draconibacterium sp. TaxID=1573823 RepID=UPI0029C8E13E|nr:lipocalin-like domain-containing protein [uncultured Draconibacterium sp.]
MKKTKWVIVAIVLVGLVFVIFALAQNKIKKEILYTKGTGVPHKTFEDEFLVHKKCSEWWYNTGYFEDENGNEYAFQFTITKLKLFGVPVYSLLTSLTDLQTEKHYFGSERVFFGKGVKQTDEISSFGAKAKLEYAPNKFSSFGSQKLSINEETYQLSLNIEAQKAPVWHCDNGTLLMGVTDDPKEVTFYYSITNMLANGTLILDGKEHKVSGKAWFDKQGGTFNPMSPKTHWEWFSFRFFDNEEIMLFSFPQGNYNDGTYIKNSGEYQRLNNYEVTPHEIIVEPTTGKNYSSGWTVRMPGVKDEVYSLRPKVNGQFNNAFYEIMADVYNKDGKLVGYCIVELLPGARNEKI